MVKCNDRGRGKQCWWPELQFYRREYEKGTLREWKEELERKKTKRVQNMGKQESGGGGHASTASSRKLRQEGR